MFLEEMSINGYGLIPLTLEKILDNEYRASLSECDEALIACEIIAAVAGRPATDLPDDLKEWIEVFLPAGSAPHDEMLALTEKAADVIDSLVADSEVRDFWEDEPLFDQWFDAQVDLQDRILK